MVRKKGTEMGKKQTKAANKKSKDDSNPWPYASAIRPILEMSRLDKEDLVTLCCRLKYCVKKVMITNEEHQNNKVYRMFGELVSKYQLFMRQWLRCHSLTNKTHVCKIAKEYLKSKGLKFKTWIKGVKDGRQADVLAVYLLCLITKTHCYVHLRYGNHWSTLEEASATHDIYEQRCNLHLAYIGN